MNTRKLSEKLRRQLEMWITKIPMRRSEITKERAEEMLTTSPLLQRKLRISSSPHQLTPAVAIPLQSPTTDPVLPSRITSRRASQSEDLGGRIWNHLNRIWRRRKQRNRRQLWRQLWLHLTLCRNQSQKPLPHHGGTSLKSTGRTVTLPPHLLRPRQL